MCICTFLGHRDCTFTIKPIVKTIIEDLILTNKIDHFYVGNHGNFDNIVIQTLKELKEKYPQINYSIVLAYLPHSRDHAPFLQSNTIFPDGIERIPKRFAISYANRWMIEKSNYVVTFLAHSLGNTAKFIKAAQQKNKIVINIASIFEKYP